MNKIELQDELEGYGLPRVLPSQVTVAVLRVQVNEQREIRGIATASRGRESLGCRWTCEEDGPFHPLLRSSESMRYLNLIAERSQKADWTNPKIFVFKTDSYKHSDFMKKVDRMCRGHSVLRAAHHPDSLHVRT